MKMTSLVLFVMIYFSSSYAMATAYSSQYKPVYYGYRVDWCKYFKRECGKPAADQLCVLKGYKYAHSYKKDENVGANNIMTRTVGDGAVCDGDSCDSFAYIICRKYNERYNQPRYNSYRLDWCQYFTGSCGKPAADAYCKSKGFNESQAFEKDNNIGKNTRVIGDDSVCVTSGCDSFKYIVCQ